MSSIWILILNLNFKYWGLTIQTYYFEYLLSYYYLSGWSKIGKIRNWNQIDNNIIF